MANRNKKLTQEEIYNDIMNNNINDKITGFNKFKPKTKSQKDYSKLIKDHEIIICSGQAGTGKSHTAIATAIELILDKSTPYKKLVITTPAVEADENIGFIPGSLSEKLEPYMSSSFYLVDKIIGKAMRDKLLSEKLIEVEGLGFIRGKSFDNCVLVIEEAQNTTPRQMKTLLTRIGENAKFIISGDLEQSDKFKSGKESGLADAMNRLRKVEEIAFFEFGPDDIVRNPIITKILKLYNESPIKPEDLHKNYGKTKDILPDIEKNKVKLLNDGVEPKNNGGKGLKKYFSKYFSW